MTISLTNILCAAFGFLLGSAGVAHGSRKRNPISFGLGLLCLLAGAAAVYLSWIDRAIDEAEEEAEAEEEEAEAEAAKPEAAPAEKPEEVAAPAEEPKAEEAAPAQEDAE